MTLPFYGRVSSPSSPRGETAIKLAGRALQTVDILMHVDARQGLHTPTRLSHRPQSTRWSFLFVFAVVIIESMRFENHRWMLYVGMRAARAIDIETSNWNATLFEQFPIFVCCLMFSVDQYVDCVFSSVVQEQIFVCKSSVHSSPAAPAKVMLPGGTVQIENFFLT